jgi:hypothetical protein
LALAEPSAGAYLLDGGGDIDAEVLFLPGGGSHDELWRGNLELFQFEGLVATSAE